MTITPTQTPRRAFAAVVIATAAISTSGCIPDPADDWKTRHQPAWTVDATLLSEPRIAGDVVLAYASIGDGEEAMIAWDVADGSELWRHTTLPGRTPPGVAHRVAALEGDDGWQVSVLVPADAEATTTDYSHVAILDARTGESLAEPLAERGVWAERPGLCGAEDDVFCIEGILEPNVNNDYDSRYVYSVEDPEFRRAEGAGMGYLNGGFSLTEHVSINDADELEYGDDDGLRWSRAYDEVFGNNAEIEGGWSWYDDGDESGDPLIGVGSNYNSIDYDVPQDVSLNLDDGTTVRLDRETGETLWSVDAQTCALTDWRLYIADDITPLCDYRSGTVDYRWNGEEPEGFRYTDVDVDLIGVDTETGATRWVVPLGNAGWSGPVDETALSYATDGESVIARVGGRVTIVDVADGSRQPLGEGEYVLCNKEPAGVTLTSIWEVPRFPLAAAHELCDATGEIVETTSVSTAALLHAGYDPTGPVAIYTPHGLSFYDAPHPSSSTD